MKQGAQPILLGSDHKRRGGRVVLLMFAILAIVGIAVYLLLGRGKLELEQLGAFHPPSAVTAIPTPSPDIVSLTHQINDLRLRIRTLERQYAELPATSATGPSASVSPPLRTTGLPDAAETLISALSRRVDGLAAETALQASQLQIDEAKLKAAGGDAAALAALAARTSRLANLLNAQAKLAIGLPLGAWPDAPPALARFATSPPPTEAQLRLAFKAAAARAVDASAQAAANAGFSRKIWVSLNTLVTIRHGDTLVVGTADTAKIDQADAALEAGDIAGSVAILDTLHGPAVNAFADWLARANSLLDARAALGTLLGHA